MNAERPLAGRRIIVTRAREQSAPLVERLTELGAAAIDAPAIRITDPPDPKAVEQALSRLKDYDLVIFTSQNAVHRVLEGLSAIGLEPTALKNGKVAAIGARTAEALRARGVEVDFVPEDFRAEGVLDSLADHPLVGRRVLLPRALVARNELPDGLRERGAVVDVVPVYETVPDEEGLLTARQALVLGVDAVTFTSSSTVRFFLTGIGADDLAAHELLDGVCLASIGPVTSDTLRDFGFRPTVEADPYIVEALVEALVQYFQGAEEAKR